MLKFENDLLVLSTDFWYQPSWSKKLCFPLLVLHRRRYLTWRDDKHLEPKHKAEYEKNECKIYVSADPGNSQVPGEVRSLVWPGGWESEAASNWEGKKKGGGRGLGGVGAFHIISNRVSIHYSINHFLRTPGRFRVSMPIWSPFCKEPKVTDLN